VWPMQLARRAGLTLIELLVGVMVTAMIAAALATVAYSVNQLDAAASGRSESAQHARVALGHIEQEVARCHGSFEFPGVAMFAQSVGTERFPDTLVVWAPDGPPADPTGLPRFREIVVFTPHPQRPRQLLRIEDRSDPRVVPPLDDEVSWQNELADMRARLADDALVLTDRMRVAAEPMGNGSAVRFRAALRFYVSSRPGPQERDDYQSGLLPWEELRWPLGMVDREHGLARTRCEIELQLVPDPESGNSDSIVYLGSAAVEFIVRKADVPTP